MNKKIFTLMMVSFIVMLIFSQPVFAAINSCTDDDYIKGTHGCKNTYELRGGMTRQCTDDHYANNTHGCRNVYDINVDGWWNAAGRFFSRNN